MFTGLIQGMGRITARTARSGQMRLSVQALFDMPDIVAGESIAVSGACLTVEEPGKNAFSAYASAETLARSTLGGLGQGDRVNLERALALGDRLGGHLVSGHVDCLARVTRISPAGESTRFELAFPPAFAALVVPKGSVALDGVSLTVNDCTTDSLTVNVIPTTQRETTISLWRTGTAVNMETDFIGKYVARMLDPFVRAAGAPSAITPEFLREHGF